MMFFALVFALSVPFWWFGSVSDLQLMPDLSVSALMTFCPMVAALLLFNRESGMAGVRGLLKRSFDYRRITDKRWYLPILLLMPAVSFVVYGLMRVLELPLPGAPTQAQPIADLLMDFPVVPALLNSRPSSSAHSAKSWAGLVTSSTRCSGGGARCGLR